MTRNNSAKPGNNYSPASSPEAIATTNGRVSNGEASTAEFQLQSTNTTPDFPLPSVFKVERQKFGLRAKATAIAIALGVLPILAVGGIAYQISSKKISEEVFEDNTSHAIEAADKLNRTMRDRYADIQLLSKLPALSNPKLAATLTIEEKRAILNNYINFYRGYENIAILSADGEGTVLLDTRANIKRGVQKNQFYYNQVLKTDSAVVTLERSLSTGKLSIYFAAPIKNTVTGQRIAVIRARLPYSVLEEVLKNYKSDADDYYLIEPDGKIFLSSQKNAVGKQATSYFSSNVSELRSEGIPDAKRTVNLAQGHKEVLAYSPLGKIEGLPEIAWGIILASDEAEAFALETNLFTTLAIGIGLTALVVAALAAYLANRATRPILAATVAVEKLGLGELDTRIAVSGRDEFAVLGSNINLMADEIQTLLAKQAAETGRVQLLAEITSRIRKNLHGEYILKTAVREIQRGLKCDRVAVVLLDSGNGSALAESVASGWKKLLGSNITDSPAFREHYIQSSNKSSVTAINNLDLQPNLTDTQKQWLDEYGVKAELVAPIRVSEQLYGILMAHQCRTAREWQPSEINLFAQLATQIGIALEQANLLAQIESARQQADLMAQEQKHQKEAIQMQLLELLSEVEAASSGDLTVRADVTDSELGTVGDFFNSIIESLRQVVSQVIGAAAQVNAAVGSTEGDIRELAEKALQQAEDITRTLNSVEQMTQSIQAVADNASLAAEVARRAAITANAGGTAMDRTVQTILNLQETVAETANKVKRLGESGQQISKAVSLIKQIALQTNVLAINASFEAARAGEEGRGFAVVAEEVAKLAARSAAASQEIQRIVENIQLETKEVVSAMEIGTTQVVDGAQQVEEAKQSLGQIVEVSRQIDELVQSISSATVSQAATSQDVMNLMNEIAKVSEQTSQSSHQVSGSLQQTIEVARQLQESVGVFKVS